jgi:hypothetical protein
MPHVPLIDVEWRRKAAATDIFMTIIAKNTDTNFPETLQPSCIAVTPAGVCPFKLTGVVKRTPVGGGHEPHGTRVGNDPGVLPQGSCLRHVVLHGSGVDNYGCLHRMGHSAMAPSKRRQIQEKREGGKIR